MYFRDAQLERDKNIFDDFFGRVIKRLKTLRSRPHTLTLQLVYLYCNMCRCRNVISKRERDHTILNASWSPKTFQFKANRWDRNGES